MLDQSCPPAELPAGRRHDAASLTGTPNSLGEIHRTVRIPAGASWLRRLLAFVGPGYMVAVGYMDPGNWATSIAGGSAFGYTLLSVALLSSLMAMLLQAICARIGIASGRDLAQLCRERFPRWMSFPLWLLAEAAICATDLAEVIGTAIALQLLFGLPLLEGVLLTVLDTLLILWLQHKGVRWLESFVIGLIALIAFCFIAQLAMADPVWGDVLRGYLPSASIVTNSSQLYLALGILGATVMPHNLYLHTAIVQSRDTGRDESGKREAIRFASIDSTVALVIALLINSAILILAAAAFHTRGHTEVAEIGDAHTLLAPLLGTAAPFLFAIALLACGLNSTVTATIAGQVVMEGFLRIRLRPALRRLVTRIIAIVPAVVVTWIYGESGTAQLLVLSQVVLSLQLPFAVIPLMLFAGDRRRLGTLVTPMWQMALGWGSAALIVVLNVVLLKNAFF
ncbi:divalent metal cation transporter MntH [Pseudoroseomonas wenyumeiae]|uniref:Divalent metal cation transporter MntH n=1 Tax=Teichococcus wenyumeiae TaxID=2478470 RepID=A0A3A9J4H2_9PROT|nr:Nramp family divalent metal transporter [Pseudoroseomonas wenyumeiae]RKK02097.1 divalent metal cation transporter [Pseudoroseomonas wenyumeiae]RMI24910.1 divalent metal cation transporter MntH [Pseudoroseomonas wenyumeiae]